MYSEKISKSYYYAYEDKYERKFWAFVISIHGAEYSSDGIKFLGTDDCRRYIFSNVYNVENDSKACMRKVTADSTFNLLEYYPDLFYTHSAYSTIAFGWHGRTPTADEYSHMQECSGLLDVYKFSLRYNNRAFRTRVLDVIAWSLGCDLDQLKEMIAMGIPMEDIIA